MQAMRTNLLSLFIPFIRLQLDVERLMYILAFNPVLFKLKLYVILNLALLTLARIKFSPLFAFARLEFTDDRFKRIVVTEIYVYIFLKLNNREHKNNHDIALIQPINLRYAELCSRCANLQNYTCDACWTFNCGN